jgi:PEP-CTERM motif-containing protein
MRWILGVIVAVLVASPAWAYPTMDFDSCENTPDSSSCRFAGDFREQFMFDNNRTDGLVQWKVGAPEFLRPGESWPTKFGESQARAHDLEYFFDSPFTLPSNPITKTSLTDMTVEGFQQHSLNTRVTGYIARDGDYWASVQWEIDPEDSIGIDRFGDQRYTDVDLSVGWHQGETEFDRYAKSERVFGFTSEDALAKFREEGPGAVPEPASIFLFSSGMAFLAWTKRRRLVG